MAQFRTDINQLDNKISTRYEVVMLADNYGNINAGTGGTAVDAFGRSRVAEPFTLFDSQHRYADNGYWSESNSGTASVHRPNESAVDMTINGSSGSYIFRETKRVFPYQPGKSLLVLNSFVFNQTKSGLRQRIGYFNTQNGFFLEQDGTDISICRRSYVNGSVQETRISKTNWNVDKFDGTGPSQRNIDLTKANIFWLDIEWLGVGDVRCGFVVDGQMAIAHVFHQDNVNTTTYMTTAVLPLRVEIENTAATGSSSTLKQICNSVISEGGYGKKVKPKIARRTTSVSISNTGWKPLIALRLNSNRLDSIILPGTYTVYCSTSPSDIELAWVRNPTSLTVGGTGWVQNGGADVCLDATAVDITTATFESLDYIATSNQIGGGVSGSFDYNFDTQLGRTISGVSDVLVLVAKTISSNSDTIASSAATFYDLT